MLRMSEIGRIDFQALEQQTAMLGRVLDAYRNLVPSDESTEALEGIWNLCHALLDWKEKNP